MDCGWLADFRQKDTKMAKRLSNLALHMIFVKHVQEHDDGERLTPVTLDVATLVCMTGQDPKVLRRMLNYQCQLGTLILAASPQKGGWREAWTIPAHFDDIIRRRHARKR